MFRCVFFLFFFFSFLENTRKKTKKNLEKVIDPFFFIFREERHACMRVYVCMYVSMRM